MKKTAYKNFSTFYERANFTKKKKKKNDIHIFLKITMRSYLRLASADAAGPDTSRLVESREYLGDAAVGHE